MVRRMASTFASISPAPGGGSSSTSATRTRGGGVQGVRAGAGGEGGRAEAGDGDGRGEVGESAAVAADPSPPLRKLSGMSPCAGAKYARSPVTFFFPRPGALAMGC